MSISVSLLGAQIFATAGLALVIQAMLGFADFKDALAFYGVYHREPRNQLVHFFGIPGIVWSLIIFMTHLPIPYLGNSFKKMLPADYQLTYGLVFTLVYLGFFLMIDPLGGTLYAPVLYAMYISAVWMHRSDQKKAGGTSWAGTGRLMSFAFVIHVLSWYVQIQLGHKVFEGAQPVVTMQSVGGALIATPLLAFYEGLWLAGINKELQNETMRLVDKYTIDLCNTGVEMRLCKTLPV